MVCDVLHAVNAVKWLVGWRSVAAATNLGHPANKQNERMLMFVAKHGKDSSKEDRRTCATIV